MEYMLFVIDLIGTVAFAFSGAMTAIRKEMDMLGVMILGMVTAVGGGIIRDIILGIAPPQAFMEPVFALGADIGVCFCRFLFPRAAEEKEMPDQRKRAPSHFGAAVPGDTNAGGYAGLRGIYCGRGQGCL